MKKKIIALISIFTLLVIIITVTVSIVFSYSAYKTETSGQIRNTCLVIAREAENRLKADKSFSVTDIITVYGDILKDSKMRLTILNIDGTVISDSSADPANMENHLTRKEVQSALSNGFGQDVRFSSTLHVEMMYYAVSISGGQTVVRVSVPLAAPDKMILNLLLYLLPFILLTGALILLFGNMFSNRILKPVKEITRMADDISTGKFSHRINDETGTELDELYKSFNSMAENLERSFASLNDKSMKMDIILDNTINSVIGLDRNANVVLINKAAQKRFNIRSDEDIVGHNLMNVIRNGQIYDLVMKTISDKSMSETDVLFRQGNDDKVLRVYIKPISEDAEESRLLSTVVYINDITELRNLEKVRTDFVSNVTHELKTPLTSIRGFVETLKNGAIDNKEVALGFLDIIDIEAERLHNLIQDILYLSEIENSRFEHNPENCCMEQVVAEVVSLLKNDAEKFDVKVLTEISPEACFTANKDRIKQMMINLVNNAIKYNKPGGSVKISCLKAEDSIRISVRDTGIGIEAGHISRIFERFYRVDAGRSRDVGGTGLGLAIVKHIVNLYNGTIKVTSKIGEGTEFVITF